MVRRRDDATLTAWRQFVAGEEIGAGVVPTPILRSWRRCRDLYSIDPGDPSPVPRQDVRTCDARYSGVYATVGGAAAGIVSDLGECVTTVTDGDGRIVASWAAPALRGRAQECRLEPGFAWSESTGGTTGMGTALVEREPVFVRGAEHWRQDMHEWTCFGAAVYDPVSDAPIVAITTFSLSPDVIARLPKRLPAELRAAEQLLIGQSYRDGRAVAERFESRCHLQRSKVVGLDWAGNVVAATADIAESLGLDSTAVMLDPRQRQRCLCPALRDLARSSLTEAAQEPGWQRTIVLGARISASPEQYSVSPVVDAGVVIGWIAAGLGDPAEPSPSDQAEPAVRSRVVAVAEGSALLLDPVEIRYAEADRHSVWLITDCGRFRAAIRGMDNVDTELSRHGFIRVHRSFLVNPARIRRVRHKGNGLITLSTDARRNEDIPVSRRITHTVRQLLGV